VNKYFLKPGTYAWEIRSFKLMAIDSDCAIVRITACGAVLSVWKSRSNFLTAPFAFFVYF
jgi:hypothetical protein